MKEFAVEFIKPAKMIMNKVTKSAQYPRHWVIELQIAIPKVHSPISENDLRLISCTAFLSKVYESFLRDWLMPIIAPYLDLATYGGVKAYSHPIIYSNS